MSALLTHLIVVPVVLPLLAATVLLLLRDRHRRLKSLVNVVATMAGLVVAVLLLRQVDRGPDSGDIGVYLAANWEAPFGIVLVADRLSALMLVVASIVSVGAAVYAEAAWARASVYFHPLFQIQLMGLGGTFLTGDLFNLFVFFEVTLAASYGLQLHGSGGPRVRAGLHYIAVNLLASSLFLVGLAVLYGVLGTLTMADIAEKMSSVPEQDRGLMYAGSAIMAVAFLIKAAIWPLNAWLVPAYSTTSAPVAALFAVMTKVGVYALMRLWTLFFATGAGASVSGVQPFGATALLIGGLATLAFATLGLTASLRLGHIASFSILVSSGTLVTALGLGTPAVTAAALYYLVTATVGVSALFLLVELIERIGADGETQLMPDVDQLPGEDTNLDDQQLPLVGRAFPVSMALLGLAFMICAMLVSGLPPLSGFIAKFALAAAVVKTKSGAVEASASAGVLSALGWIVVALLLLSGLAAIVALTRAGIRHLWTSRERAAPRVRRVEAAAVVSLIFCGLLLTVRAESVLRYTSAAAAGLHAPRRYVHAVSSAKSRPGPTTPLVGRGDGS